MDHRFFLSAIFLVSGTFNVLVVNWANHQQVIGSDGKRHGFQHPVVFTLLMFLGEFLCFVIFKVIRLIASRSENSQIITDLDSILTEEDSTSREFSPLSMLLPAVLDAVASILLFTGLYFTNPTSFQMIRGASTIFAGVFSAIFLNHTLTGRQWLAIFTISCALLDIIYLDVLRVKDEQATLPFTDYKSILTGDLLIIIAEILHGLQYVCEEKQLKTSDVVPLQAAGWQGIFGLVITSLLAICLNFLPSVRPFNDSSRAVFDDWSDLVLALTGKPSLILALIGFAISCASYNFVGVFITMDSSSISRLLVDALRPLFVWMFFWDWNNISPGVIIGFVVLQMGIKLYSQALFLDSYRAIVACWHRACYEDLSSEDAVAPNSPPEETDEQQEGL
ncbi:solute carrier family 35 member F6-like [Drosophila rhopaloa]|uniref:Solute carrier family 35 member F6 n=3 Tax=Drosophila rhopaloa TaxID=1041015 RepID=A0ABM5HPC1_DRORH|nr:solute carrier family 35 member F6-like [Drosophila rhopaloa]